MAAAAAAAASAVSCQLQLLPLAANCAVAACCLGEAVPALRLTLPPPPFAGLPLLR